jgi:hypothetical protein
VQGRLFFTIRTHAKLEPDGLGLELRDGPEQAVLCSRMGRPSRLVEF